MTSIQKRLSDLRQTIPTNVELVAVSKFHPIEALREAYDAGQRIFGESRVQELVAKKESLPSDIQWHFIGHLQANKVKYIAPFISLIHAVDSEKLLLEIDRQAVRNERTIPCLLQLHVAQEETKFGFSLEECWAMLQQGTWKDMKGAQISGIMCMATNTDNTDIIRADFETAARFFEDAKNTFFSDLPYFFYRSWGMSSDYLIAVETGANLVRIGTTIFGEREY